MDVFVQTSPLLWIGFSAVIGTIGWGLSRFLIQTLIIVVAVVAAFWFVAPGGQQIVRTANQQPTFSGKAACVLQAVSRIAPLTSNTDINSVSACVPPADDHAQTGKVEAQAAQRIQRDLDARRLQQ